MSNSSNLDISSLLKHPIELNKTSEYIPKKKQRKKRTNTKKVRDPKEKTKSIKKRGKVIKGFDTSILKSNSKENYEPIPDIINHDNVELLNDLTIDSVRENRNIKGKKFTIIHKKRDEIISDNKIDEIVKLYNKFLEECLDPMEKTHPEAFKHIENWIDRFGGLKELDS